MTYRNLVQEVGAILDLDVTPGSEEDTSVKLYANMAQQRVVLSRPWPFRAREVTLQTVPAVTFPNSSGVGTITTVQGSLTIVGVGTSFTPAMVGEKFAVGLNAPYYRIQAVPDALHLTLARPYLELGQVGIGGIVYQDEYDLPTLAETLVQAILLVNQGYGPVMSISQARMNENFPVQVTTGQPAAIALVTETSPFIAKRVGLIPVPDVFYALTVRYSFAPTDMALPTDLVQVPPYLEELLLKFTTLLSQNIAYAKQVLSESTAEQLLTTAWRAFGTSQQAPMVIQKLRYNEMQQQYSGVWWGVGGNGT